jgi:gliding motility-associated-like protein
MFSDNMKKLTTLVLMILGYLGSAQSLVMNEVSNGPSGNMEYVEFVVADTTVVYNCSGITNPPTIDIRGWIFDDNSGYHGAAGVASGCIRFSNNSVWSNVPVGTILLIYNEADPNINLPPIDTLWNDGNCRIVVPVDKVNWFDRNGTTPGAIVCSYPSTGWLAGGTWSTTLLANGGDCARVVNLAGCEMFSVAWGTASSNPLIYFAGTAQDRVYYFANTLNNDATNQSNWISGCADPGSCGSNTQTPGAPNNPANAAWINSMNNNCTPIPPLSASITSGPGLCPCSATAAITATGSIPPYSYTWTPNPGSGQGTSAAGGLCSGTYTCIVESIATGCTQTLVVSTSNGTVGTTASNTGSCCEGSSFQLSTPVASSYTWTGPSGFTSSIQNPTINPATISQSGTYTISVLIGSCLTTATTNVLVNPSPSVVASGTSICSGASALISATGAQSYTWNPGGTNANTLSVNPSSTQQFTVVGTNSIGCTNTAIATIIVNSNPTLSINNSSVCSGKTATLNATGATTFTWLPSGTSGSNFTIVPITDYTATVIGANGPCTSTALAYISILPSLSLAVSDATTCSGQTVTLNAFGASTYTWMNGPNTSTYEVAPLQSTTYTVSGNSPLFCDGSASVNVIVRPLPVISISNATTCLGKPLMLTANGGSTYLWNGPNNLTVTSSSLNIPATVPANAGQYTVTVTDNNGCINRQTLLVEIDKCSCEVFVPEGFSPNGDGAHDAFVISCIENKETKIQIFNRWGNLVYKSDIYNNDWNGTCNTGLLSANGDLPSGTYYYIVRIEGEEKDRTGFLTLWR